MEYTSFALALEYLEYLEYQAYVPVLETTLLISQLFHSTLSTAVSVKNLVIPCNNKHIQNKTGIGNWSSENFLLQPSKLKESSRISKTS